jgi:mono/diheme cytochrome c family protein
MNAQDKMLVSIVSVSGSGYLALALLMGVLPGLWLSHVPAGPGIVPLTAEQEKGRQVYVAEGCAYCHTQQVRPLLADAGFGRPSSAGDFAYQTPELLGSERTGPDLTNIGRRQSGALWHYIHLYQPRSVVPPSIMPAFPWLFRVVDEAPPGATLIPVPPLFAPAHGVVIASKRAVALVAYLTSLKQPGPPPLVPSLVPKPTPATAPALGPSSPSFDAAAGSKLFADNCSACHGDQGAGVPGAFPSLVGDPVVNDANPVTQIRTVLNGLSGKTIRGTKFEAAMPPFADIITDEQIADIIDHERSSWGNNAILVTARDVALQRASH